MARIAVIGIGNVLTGDDALGPTVVRRFEAAWVVPPDVSVIDAGTPGLDLTAFMAGLEALIVVDVVRTKGAPGTLTRHDKPAILEKAPIVALSPHEPSLRESLLHADFQGVAPPTVVLVGAIPTSVDYGLGLSAPVKAAVPALVERVREELLALGVAVTPREPPGAPDLWWERGA